MSVRIAIVGGGLAGLSAAIKIAEAGHNVDLFSLVPVKRSHSVCAQGGINGAKNTKGEGDHPDIHIDDTLFGGEFLADQPLVRDLCYMAPPIIDLLDRMGVMFNRTPEGHLDFRRFGGTLFHRTAYAGATTGQQLMYALDEQVRRHETEGRVRKFEYWEFLSIVQDASGECVGLTAMNLHDMTIEAFPAGAVIVCTGGPGLVFGKSTNSIINTGAAASRCYQQGAWYANPEFIQVHPTSIPGADKLRLISESVRGEGGRVWVPRKKGDTRPPVEIPEAERWYFLEEKFPKYGNLVPRDVATREIFEMCRQGYGVGGERQVYLDITPERTGQKPEVLERKLGGVFEIYRKFAGDDPLQTPMRIFPGMHYSMGGLWVAPTDGELDGRRTLKQMTNIPGLFAAGEVDSQYHGANRLGANSLVSCIVGGFLAGPRAVEWAKSRKQAPAAALAAEKKRQEEFHERIYKMTTGAENATLLHRELGQVMTDECTVVRSNAGLDRALGKLRELLERWERINLGDTSRAANQQLSFTRALRDMIVMAIAIAKGARQRDECRGSHYKPETALAAPAKPGVPERSPAYRDYVKRLGEANGAELRRLQPPANLTGENPPEYEDFMKEWIRRQEQWLKTTLARFTEDGPEISYVPVAVTIEPPRPRIYD